MDVLATDRITVAIIDKIAKAQAVSRHFRRRLNAIRVKLRIANFTHGIKTIVLPHLSS